MYRYKHVIGLNQYCRYENISFEYVSYKWPPFLRPQTEKQRQIWANKILFLDVLFPLDLKRVVYIDADQIVRGDIGDLWDMDLDDRVYGFTPFCQEKEETSQFRFWDKGYWRDHLKGKPYHIRQHTHTHTLTHLHTCTQLYMHSLFVYDNPTSVCCISAPFSWLILTNSDNVKLEQNCVQSTTLFQETRTHLPILIKIYQTMLKTLFQYSLCLKSVHTHT